MQSRRKTINYESEKRRDTSAQKEGTKARRREEYILSYLIRDLKLL